MYRLVLKLYLALNQMLFDRVMYHIAPKCFGGSHPKNIFNYRAEFFLENVTSEDVVLDMACGQGGNLNAISKKILKGIGVDLDEKMLSLAREKASHNLLFIRCDIYQFDEKLTMEKYGVTKVLLSHILEHIEDPVVFLRRFFGKRLLICVPSQENWHKQLLKSLLLNYLSDPTHYREYTRAMLVEHLTSAGFHIEYIGFNPEGEIVCCAK